MVCLWAFTLFEVREVNFEGIDMGIHWPWRGELSSLSWILVCLLMNLRLRCLNSRFLTSTGPQKCDLRYDCSEDLLDNRKKSFKCITPLDVPFEKRAQTMVFYDNRDLSIVKFKKSEKYIREEFEIFILLSSTKTLRMCLPFWKSLMREVTSYCLGDWITDSLRDTSPLIFLIFSFVVVVVFLQCQWKR